MRGCLLNPMSGFTSNQFNHNVFPLQNLHVQEMGFWMWRVMAIRLAISIVLTPPDDEENENEEPESINFSGFFGCPINGINGPWRTERDQVVNRVGFRNTSDGMRSELDLENPAIGWSARFCEGFPHNPTFPGETGWAMTASLRATFSHGIFDTERDVATDQSGMFLTITGGDPILGANYFHLVPMWIRALTEDWTVQGGGVIQPILFQEWRDGNGVPLYNISNGTYA